ncbi:MAG: EAL domain-containing protein [Lachnospiraceae bacterium]|nr:EAL domain-containing protein [Lachnospiraceae bacterium]
MDAEMMPAAYGGAYGLIHTNDNCVGCNKCIATCSCVGACVSTDADENGRSRIVVDPDRCIACGACFDVCEHNAREYSDDTERFFSDLARGEKISILIAPAFKANYPEEYESVLGGLKKCGVNRMINVSFGADITTWGYINYIQKYGFKGGISQPCPAVVTFIEKYHPELLPKLIPVQSPLMCAAIYAKKEMGVTDKLAFISPCIAKKLEIDDPNNHGHVSYNVTFSHLMKYIRDHGIRGEAASDEVEYGLGSYYPTPGGLMENVKWLLGEETFVREICGEKRLYRYLRESAGSIAAGNTPFLLYDALNCENGCICGTAVDPLTCDGDRALNNLLRIREGVKTDAKGAWARNLTPQERLEQLNEQFAGLELTDYIREYTDRSEKCRNLVPTEEELDKVFHSMRKDTEESRRVNCSSCGYETCQEMACAIFNGFNHRDNCVYYLKREVEDEKEQLLYKATHDDALGIWNRQSAIQLLQEMGGAQPAYSVVIADINGFKSINATYGHAVTDGFLRILVGRLKERVESQGVPIVRYGGDEFLFLIPGYFAEISSRIVTDIQRAFIEPMYIDHNHLTMNVSIGLAWSDEHTDAEELILHAEAAMNEAKNRGRNRIALYAEELKEKARQEKRIGEKVKEALDNDGFHLLYQPQIESRTKQTSGFEALVRMKEPGLYPGRFIPIAERNGWIWRIRLLMDDFGTGYSSLGYLTYIPADIIKLDKSLVDNYLTEGKESFIDNVIRLVHDLGKKMIVEGVEKRRQFERLRDFGADMIQGYYFSRPIPPDEAIRFKAL